MSEFFVGALFVFAVFWMLGAMKAMFFFGRRLRHGRRWHHHGPHGGYHGRWEGGPRRRGRRAGFGRAAGEVFKRRLDIDPDQEDIVDHALRDLRASLKELGGTLKDGRADLAAAFAGDEVDQSALDALFARQDDELGRTRREVVSALKQIHAVLDDDQRQRATEWLGHGSIGWA